MLRTQIGQRRLGTDGRPIGTIGARADTRSPRERAQTAVDEQVTFGRRTGAQRRLRLSPADEDWLQRRGGVSSYDAETVRPRERPISSRSPPTIRTLAANVERAGRQVEAAAAAPPRIAPESIREQTETLQAALGQQTQGIAGSIGLLEDTVGQQTRNLVAAIREATARNDLDERSAAQALHNLREHPLTADLVQRGLLRPSQVVRLADVKTMERNLRMQQMNRGNDGTEQRAYSTRVAVRETPMEAAHNQPTGIPGVFMYRPPRFAKAQISAV